MNALPIHLLHLPNTRLTIVTKNTEKIASFRHHNKPKSHLAPIQNPTITNVRKFNAHITMEEVPMRLAPIVRSKDCMTKNESGLSEPKENVRREPFGSSVKPRLALIVKRTQVLKMARMGMRSIVIRTKLLGTPNEVAVDSVWCVVEAEKNDSIIGSRAVALDSIGHHGDTSRLSQSNHGIHQDLHGRHHHRRQLAKSLVDRIIFYEIFRKSCTSAIYGVYFCFLSLYNGHIINF